MIADLRILKIELYKVIMTVPAFVPEWIAAGAWTAEVEILEPAAVLRALSLFLNVHELRESSAYVVEHAVKNDADTVFMESVTDKAERVVITKTSVAVAISEYFVSEPSEYWRVNLNSVVESPS